MGEFLQEFGERQTEAGRVHEFEIDGNVAYYRGNAEPGKVLLLRIGDRKITGREIGYYSMGLRRRSGQTLADIMGTPTFTFRTGNPNLERELVRYLL